MISLVAGLGNVGPAYKHTRHNVGFEAIKLLENRMGADRMPSGSIYDWSVNTVGDRKVILVRPTTMMNGSGRAISVMLEEEGITVSEMLVVVDDFNLPLGSLRFREAGSAGGHNGLDSIIEHLQTEDFRRLRLGVGPLPEEADAAEFVLEKFGAEEQKKADKMLETAAEAVIFAFEHRFEETMSEYNINPA